MTAEHAIEQPSRGSVAVMTMLTPSELVTADAVPSSLLSRSVATTAGRFSAAWTLADAAHHAPFAAGRRGVPGVDYAWTKPSIASLKGAGEVFVAQYFSRDPTKNLTPARTHDLLAAGVSIVVVWEYDAQAMLGGKAAGERDATDAETQARACGVDGIPIYFAADWDATPGQQTAIDGYLDGCAAVLGHARVGMYGGFWPTSRAKAAGKTSFLWGTPAWSGDEWAVGGVTPDIMQGAMITIGGVQCDLDAGLSSDFGQWPRPPAPATTWREWITRGHTSLEQVGAEVGMLPSSILRRTALHYGVYDDVIAGYVSGVFAGTISPSTVIPSGGKLWVRS